MGCVSHRISLPPPTPQSHRQDPDLAWLAANFMAQPHPLVQAMATRVRQAGGGLAAAWLDALDDGGRLVHGTLAMQNDARSR